MRPAQPARSAARARATHSSVESPLTPATSGVRPSASRQIWSTRIFSSARRVAASPSDPSATTPVQPDATSHAACSARNGSSISPSGRNGVVIAGKTPIQSCCCIQVSPSTRESRAASAPTGAGKRGIRAAPGRMPNMNSSAGWHTRPWHGPIPARAYSLAWRAGHPASSCPSRTSSQRQTIVPASASVRARFEARTREPGARRTGAMRELRARRSGAGSTRRRPPRSPPRSPPRCPPRWRPRHPRFRSARPPRRRRARSFAVIHRWLQRRRGLRIRQAPPDQPTAPARTPQPRGRRARSTLAGRW